MNRSGAFACARKVVVPCGVQDQAGVDPGLVAVVVARLEAVPGGQLGEVSTEAAHIALICGRHRSRCGEQLSYWRALAPAERVLTSHAVYSTSRSVDGLTAAEGHDLDGIAVGSAIPALAGCC
jgi:hypothetical protein